MPLHLKNFIDVTRLNKPIGFLLLFWPCSWGLSLANYFNKDMDTFFNYLFLFFCGSVLMRSAGCIFNDIVDRDLDKKVKRTKKRPIASGKISVSQSLVYVIILCSIAFLILLIDSAFISGKKPIKKSKVFKTIDPGSKWPPMTEQVSSETLICT